MATRHINYGDAVDPQDAVPLHQVQAIATAAAVPATAGAVATTGHAAESVLISIAGTVSDLALTANTVVGRGPSGDVVAVPFSTIAGVGAITALTGDVTASGPGSVPATIQPGAVTNAKRANMAASTLSGNATGSPAAPTDLTAAAVKTLLAFVFADVTGTLQAAQFPALTGDVTTTAGSLATSLVNLPQSVLIARTGALTAALPLNAQKITGVADPSNPQDAATKHYVDASFSGGVPLIDGNKGDITVSGSGATWTVNNGVIIFAKMQTIPTTTLIGRQTAGTGAPESIGVTGGIEFDGGSNIRRSALTGDVIASAGSAGTVIQPGVVTNAKRANMAASTLSGNSTGSPAAPTDLTAAAVKTLLAIVFGDITGTLQAAQFPVLTGDVTTVAGALATTLARIPNGVAMAGDLNAVPIAAPATPAAGHALIYVDSTGKVLAVKNDGGGVTHTVVTQAPTANQFVTGINADGTVPQAQPGFADLTGSLLASQFPALTGDVTSSGGSFSTAFGVVAAQTILANPSAFSGRPAAQSVATVRTMLGLDAPQSFDVLLSFGTGDGTNGDSLTPQSAGPGNWPFFLLPNTRNSDIPNNGYSGGNHDANLATPATVNEWRVTGAFGHVELSVEVSAVIGIGGGSVVFILSKNGLLDASPCSVTITTTGFFSSGVISLGGFAFTGADRVGVRAQVLGGSVGAQLKATVTVHLTP